MFCKKGLDLFYNDLRTVTVTKWSIIGIKADISFQFFQNIIFLRFGKNIADRCGSILRENIAEARETQQQA